MVQFFDGHEKTFWKLSTFTEWSQKYTFTFYLIILGRPFLAVIFFCHSLRYIIWRLQLFAPSFFVRDQIREFNSPPTDIEIWYTPPRPSEISEKNWNTKAKPFLTSHLWYKAMLKVWRKSCESFKFYHLTNTDNQAQIWKLWPDWLC